MGCDHLRIPSEPPPDLPHQGFPHLLETLETLPDIRLPTPPPFPDPDHRMAEVAGSSSMDHRMAEVADASCVDHRMAEVNESSSMDHSPIPEQVGMSDDNRETSWANRMLIAEQRGHRIYEIDTWTKERGM